MSSHSKAAAKFIADAPRTAWHDKALFAVRSATDDAMKFWNNAALAGSLVRSNATR